LLISKNVGARGIIPALTNDDIIQDVDDENEVMAKLIHVLKNPNNQRLISSVDRESTSLQARADELMTYCQEYL
jgi:hypothetical protein